MYTPYKFLFDSNGYRVLGPKIKYILFRISGGRGKSVMATAVLRAIRKQYPGIIVIVLTAYTDVFDDNENVDIVLGFNTSEYVYMNHIEGKYDEVEFFFEEPYEQKDFFYRNGHLTEV